MPIFAFLLVFVIVYALLAKTEALGENNFVHLFVSFVLAIIFVVSPTAKDFVAVAFPWLAVFIVSLVFIILVLAFMGGKLEDTLKSPALAWVIVGGLIIIFLIAAINVFGPVIRPYLPGMSEAGGAEMPLQIKHIILHPSVLGALILLFIAAVVSWILTREND